MLTSDDIQKFSTVIRKELAPLEQRMDSFDNKMDSLDTKVNSLDTKVNSLDAKVNSLDAKVNSLDAKVDSFDAKVNSLDAKVDSLGDRTGLLEKQAADFQGKFDSNVRKIVREEVAPIEPLIRRIERDFHRHVVLQEQRLGILDDILQVVVASKEALDSTLPLRGRVDQCESDVTMLKHVVKEHIADKILHPRS